MGLRCFIALELPEVLKKEIDSRTSALRASGADVKWVPADNLHLTLKFLGETEESKLPIIGQAMRASARGKGRIRLSFRGVGVFPDVRRPRVVWVGVSEEGGSGAGPGEAGLLGALQKEIDTAVAGLGYEPESRAFRPHLTIGRVRSPKRKEALIGELRDLEVVYFGEVDVESVSLMKSELRPDGARYTRIDAASLV